MRHSSIRIWSRTCGTDRVYGTGWKDVLPSRQGQFSWLRVVLHLPAAIVPNACLQTCDGECPPSWSSLHGCAADMRCPRTSFRHRSSVLALQNGNTLKPPDVYMIGFVRELQAPIVEQWLALSLRDLSLGRDGRIHSTRVATPAFQIPGTTVCHLVLGKTTTIANLLTTTIGCGV